MNIDTPLRELGPVDMDALRDAVLAQDEIAWQEDKYRQEEFEVHRSTESIVLVFVDLDQWPNIVVSQEPGWPRLSDVALPLMIDIISRFYPAGRYGDPGHGGEIIEGRRNFAAHGQASVLSQRPPYSCPDYHESAGTLHDRWATVPVQSR